MKCLIFISLSNLKHERNNFDKTTNNTGTKKSNIEKQDRVYITCKTIYFQLIFL